MISYTTFPVCNQTNGVPVSMTRSDWTIDFWCLELKSAFILQTFKLINHSIGFLIFPGGSTFKNNRRIIFLDFDPNGLLKWQRKISATKQ